MPFSNRTVTITVTYNPRFDLLRRQLESLEKQCLTILVDNHSEEEFLKPIRQYCNSYSQATLIALDNNTGIANAQNTGIRHILKNHPEVENVLLLDHDSIPPENMVGSLEKILHTLTEREMKVAALGPLLFDPRDNSHIGFHVLKMNLFYKRVIPETGSTAVECQGINSSGSLIPLAAIRDVGFLDKGFFIDHVETEWCYRAIDKGYKIYGTAEVVLEHLMGDDTCLYWFFGLKRMPYRSPLRHYYIVRNSMLLQKRPYVPFVWKGMNILKILFTLLYFGFFSKESDQHRYYIRKGFIDGFKGRTGKIPAQTSEFPKYQQN